MPVPDKPVNLALVPGGPAFRDRVTDAKAPRPTVSGYDETSQHLGSEIAAVLQGEGTAQEALDRAAAASADALIG